MQDYSKPHDGVAGNYDGGVRDLALGTMVEGFERASDQLVGQQVIHMPGVDSVSVTLAAVSGESIDLLVDAVRATVAGEEELTVDILLGIDAGDVQALAFFINKLGAMLVARSSVDEITTMIEAKQKKEKKEKEENK